DGIRDYKVTGVQTCALPIFLGSETGNPTGGHISLMHDVRTFFSLLVFFSFTYLIITHRFGSILLRSSLHGLSTISSPKDTSSRRSEERRVGKECKTRWCM